jgi:hypothetical protein
MAVKEQEASILEPYLDEEITIITGDLATGYKSTTGRLKKDNGYYLRQITDCDIINHPIVWSEVAVLLYHGEKAYDIQAQKQGT